MPFPPSNPALERALAGRAYVEPTAVQLAVLQGEARGRDLLVSAQTGSGKTVAFGLALAQCLLGTDDQFETAAEPLALIVAPTRELAMQVQRELVWLYAFTGARIASCVGGMDVRTEKAALAAGAHIVVGTPGRLRDHLERGRLDISKLRAVVLDEADEMLDLGFREDLQFILDATPADRQTLLFSATMPKEIVSLARNYQRDAVRIETAVRNQPHGDIEYRAIRVAPNDVEHAVVNVLRYFEMRAALVFCATRESVRRLHASLMERGFAAVALSGELSQSERTNALQSVRDGRSRVLVATDVAARGLDLPDLTLVIHADLPNDKETLLHRSGRTGRAGKKGICALIVPHTRRRRAEHLLASANVKAAWASAPSADDVRTRDQERLLNDPIFAEAATEEELTLGRALLAGRTADDLALALVRFHRARLPAPEDILDGGNSNNNDASKWERRAGNRDGRPPRDQGGSFRQGSPHQTGSDTRAISDDMVWFKLNIGHEQNADPRWLLPLICRAGHVTKKEIGAIRIFDRDSKFQIVKEHADRFAAAVKTDTHKEAHISRVSPRDGAPTALPARDRPASADGDRVAAGGITDVAKYGKGSGATKNSSVGSRPANAWQPKGFRQKDKKSPPGPRGAGKPAFNSGFKKKTRPTPQG